MKSRTCLFLMAGALFATRVTAQPVMSVKITSPSTGTHFAKCSEIVITVDPQIQGGEIKTVSIYRNNVAATSRAKAPWEYKLKNYPPGYYAFMARMTAKTNEVVYSDPIYVYVGDARKGNILMNGEFDCGANPWTLGLAGGTGASATFTIDTSAGISTGAAAVVEIDSGGSANWHVQLAQPLAVDSGHTYILSFTAQTTESAKTIDIAFQMNRDPWTVYYQASPMIEALQDYGPFAFESTVTDHDAFIRFNIGGTRQTIVWLDNIEVFDASLTGVRDRKPPNTEGAPSKNLLSRNYPNPFNPSTTILYQLPEEGTVTLTLCNLKGQAVNTLVQENQKPGDHSVQWNGTNEAGERVPSGVYVYRLKVKTSERTSTLSRKIMLLQ